MKAIVKATGEIIDIYYDPAVKSAIGYGWVKNGTGETFTDDELDFSKIRKDFDVEFEENPDAREGFQQIVRVRIGSTKYGLPAISLEELETLYNSIGDYLHSKIK